MGIKATKENLTFSHVKSFIQAKLRRAVLSSDFINILERNNIDTYIFLPKHKREQIIWRISMLQTHPQGKQCLINNECPCKCTTSEVILADSACDKLCFPEMLNVNDWEKYKLQNKFHVLLDQQKVVKYNS